MNVIATLYSIDFKVAANDNYILGHALGIRPHEQILHSQYRKNFLYGKKNNYNREASECLNSLSDLQQNYDIYLFSC